MDKRGFTLIEVIVSTILIAVLVIGLASIFLSGNRYILHSRRRMTSGELGMVFLDPLQMDVRQDTWGSNCLSNKTNCPPPQSIGSITYTPDYSDITDIAGTSLRRVKLTINW